MTWWFKHLRTYVCIFIMNKFINTCNWKLKLFQSYICKKKKKNVYIKYSKHIPALNCKNFSYKISEWKSLHDLLRQNSKSINHFFNFSHLTILKQTSSSNTHIQIEFGAREKNILFFNLLASQLNFSKISVCFSEKGIFFPFF